jgi:hypothetical protein
MRERVAAAVSYNREIGVQIDGWFSYSCILYYDNTNGMEWKSVAKRQRIILVMDSLNLTYTISTCVYIYIYTHCRTMRVLSEIVFGFWSRTIQDMYTWWWGRQPKYQHLLVVFDELILRARLIRGREKKNKDLKRNLSKKKKLLYYTGSGVRGETRARWNRGGGTAPAAVRTVYRENEQPFWHERR